MVGKCAANPCASGYKCTDFSEGYQCKCMDPTKCDMDTTGCEDASCIKGNSRKLSSSIALHEVPRVFYSHGYKP